MNNRGKLCFTMKFKQTFCRGLALICGLLLLNNCATRPPIVLEVVGPASPGRSGTGKGYLQVYSATDKVQDGKLDFYPHTGYTVYDATNKFVHYTPNRIGNTDPVPVTISLTAGTYKVVARAELYGRVTVPVKIDTGRLTVVYLERGGMPEKIRPKNREFVTLPNGDFVGVKEEAR